jgi:DNA mismatch repair protein MutH
LSTKKYDDTSVESIVSYSQSLSGHSLDEIVTLPIGVANKKNKGNLGGMVEAHFFELTPTTSGLDFPKAGLELKVTGLIPTGKGKYKAKERLVLTMINYMEIVQESWSSSTFYTKCRLMLILFYLYEKDVSAINLKFILNPFLFRIENHDLETIKRDWEFIQHKVKLGKAHELSEGDTFYLGATRKGEGGKDEALRPQPNSPIGAKSRAFAFKQKYVNLLIAGHVDGAGSVLEDTRMSIEEATQRRFARFIGQSVEHISDSMDYRKSGPNHKGFLYDLSKRILGNGAESILELEKADIQLKTVRLTKAGKPREHMSFPAFNLLEIADQEWEDSNFFERLEKKFLFVVFQEGADRIERLLLVAYWNMPYDDRIEAQRVWEETKRRVSLEQLPLPAASESRVSHVRPKGQNKQDTQLMPSGSSWVKQCFWLNSSYVGSVIREIQDLRDTA